MFQCQFSAAEMTAILVLPRILTWIRNYLGGLAIVDPEKELRPRLTQMRGGVDTSQVEGGLQKVIEFKIKVHGLELRICTAVESSTGQTYWQPVAASWDARPIGREPFTGDDIHFDETILECEKCGVVGPAYRFEMNRICRCDRILHLVAN